MELMVDCDPGIDDAIALAYLAGEHRAGCVTLTSVTTVRGNLGVAETGRNAAFMLDQLGLGHVPVYRGADQPLAPLGSHLNAVAFHGQDGLGGNHDPSHPDRAGNQSQQAVHDALVATAQERRTLLAVGPLTNLALAFRADPNLASSFGQLVIMGGAFGSPGGNITPRAEFNFYVDGTAAAEVTGSGAQITLIPLDVTHQVLIRRTDLDSLSSTPTGELVRRLLEASIEIHDRKMGLDGCIMHDALAAAVALNPDLVHCDTGCLRVGETGHDRGHSELERAPDGPVAVALGVDADAARNQILDSLARL